MRSCVRVIIARAAVVDDGLRFWTVGRQTRNYAVVCCKITRTLRPSHLVLECRATHTAGVRLGRHRIGRYHEGQPEANIRGPRGTAYRWLRCHLVSRAGVVSDGHKEVSGVCWMQSVERRYLQRPRPTI